MSTGSTGDVGNKTSDDAGDEPALGRTVSNDITASPDSRSKDAELQRLQNLLAAKDLELEELRSQLVVFDQTVASVRHDTNNPLAVVIGQAQFLTMRIGNLPEDVTRRLRVIEEMSQRIRQTLDLLINLKQKPPASP